MDTKKSMNNGRPTVKLSDINFMPVLVALVVIFLTFVLYYLWKKKSAKRSHILIMGLCESGKTLLFSQLLYEESRETFTSICENDGDYSVEGNSEPIPIIDIPGNERLRSKFLDQYKNSAKGIIYVIDSVTVQKDIRDVADFLYTILADSSVSSTPILIVCNKQDETLAKGQIIVKSLLEKELNLVRNTRRSQLQSVDGSPSEQITLGKLGKEFEFEHINQRIDFVECSAKECDLENVHTWIQAL